ncbi:MAG: hypothetical protein ACRED5_16645 [Propylenella sp.]
MLTLRTLVAFTALVWAGFAQAADAPPSGEIAGACADPWVLGRIQGRFAWAERYNWQRGFVMQAIENPRPSGHPYAEPGLIAHDYCMADAVMTNGDVRTIYYAIEHGVGFAGIGRYVDFCVLGLDPWHVHDGSCRTVR